jgi:hypothetical protein
MKLADILGNFRNKNEEYLNFKADGKIKNIRDLYKGISDFKKGYQPRTIIVEIRRVISLQTPIVFCRGVGTISPTYETYMG